MTDGDGTNWLPDDASLVALVRARDGGAWAAGVAVGLADIVGRRRGRTFLANTIAGAMELDGLMEADHLPGITAVLSGELPVSAIARSAPRQSFAYLPAGRPALPLHRLREIPAFRNLLRRVADRGGTVLLYVAEEDFDQDGPADPDLDLPVDGCIAIGEVEDAALTIGAPLLARVERPSTELAGTRDGVPDQALAVEPATGAGEASPGAGAAESRRRGVPAWAPWLGVATGLLLAWLAWGSFGPDSPADDASDPGMEAPAAGAESGAGTEMPAGAGPAPLSDDAGEPAFAAPELPYSVLVASFARSEDADRQAEALDPDEMTVIIAPTPIRGRIYHRILVGALEDRMAAEALMRDLVDAGVKEQVRAWDVRPVRHAFLLGTYGSREEADGRLRQLRDDGIPAYVLGNGSRDAPLYRVYSGAYESEQAAIEFGRVLDAAGEAARLVTRKGTAT